MERRQENLIKFVESISEQIQVLALNIAVAAARMSARKELNIEINSKLSKLVSQATLAVKNMNHVLQAAGAEKTGKNIAENIYSLKNDSEVISHIESSLTAILNDSQKILDMLREEKQKSLEKPGA